VSSIINSETQTLWGTPFLRRMTDAPPGYNQELVDIIRQAQNEAPGTTAGVVDAQKSRSDLLRWEHPVIEALRDWIVQAALDLNARVDAGRNPRGEEVDMVAEAWAVVYREWGYHTMHAHHDSAWSGVYYVDVGDSSEHAGTVEFLDPRSAAIARQPDRAPLHTVVPEAGLLIAFPSWLRHWVTPHGGSRDRICVAFNVGFAR
jgi:uncharacterized protein (TIGR02466 family)